VLISLSLAVEPVGGYTTKSTLATENIKRSHKFNAEANYVSFSTVQGNKYYNNTPFVPLKLRPYKNNNRSNNNYYYYTSWILTSDGLQKLPGEQSSHVPYKRKERHT